MLEIVGIKQKKEKEKIGGGKGKINEGSCRRWEKASLIAGELCFVEEIGTTGGPDVVYVNAWQCYSLKFKTWETDVTEKLHKEAWEPFLDQKGEGQLDGN